MTFTVRIAYAEGAPVDQPERFADRPAAIAHALALAEELGRTFSSGDRGRATRVTIHDEGALDIAIHVVRGGLTGRPPHEGLLDL